MRLRNVALPLRRRSALQLIRLIRHPPLPPPPSPAVAGKRTATFTVTYGSGTSQTFSQVIYVLATNEVPVLCLMPLDSSRCQQTSATVTYVVENVPADATPTVNVFGSQVT